MSTVLHSKLWVKVCIVVVVVGLVAAVYAYSRLSQTTAGPRVSVTSPPLEFSMELEKTQFQIGENITIKYRLENIGNETIMIRISQPAHWPDEYKETSYANVHAPNDLYFKEFHFGYRITYVNGTEIYDIRHGILPYAYYFNIDTGGWLEQTIIWDHISPRLPLSRGTYQIAGIFDYALDGSPVYALETPSITFEIE